MKTIVIYYSLDGNCALVAEAIKKQLGCDCACLEPEHDVVAGKEGFAKYFHGGRQVFSKACPRLKPLGVDIAAYDFVILGTPVWGGSPAPAMRSFLREVSLKGKKTAVFVCHKGGKGKVFAKMRVLLDGGVPEGEIDFVEPRAIDPESGEKRAAEWAATLPS
ncbi:MAG: flavodoxin family protein [Spirochaetaceae bacterium]|jgi:flavodoxin|nr:flavodoxin family protein [Spirochaetaceae bacterium]